jgi:hypothetical protein
VFLDGLPKLETILIVIFANLIIIIFTDFSPAENSYKLINEREYDCHYRKLKYCNIPFIKILREEVSVNRTSAHVFQVTEQNHDLESELK